jgi:hypothetical protein
VNIKRIADERLAVLELSKLTVTELITVGKELRQAMKTERRICNYRGDLIADLEEKLKKLEAGK